MPLTIDLPPDKDAALKARAEAAGLRAERYSQQILERDLEAQPASGDSIQDERSVSGQRAVNESFYRHVLLGRSDTSRG